MSEEAKSVPEELVAAERWEVDGGLKLDKADRIRMWRLVAIMLVLATLVHGSLAATALRAMDMFIGGDPWGLIADTYFDMDVAGGGAKWCLEGQIGFSGMNWLVYGFVSGRDGAFNYPARENALQIGLIEDRFTGLIFTDYNGEGVCVETDIGGITVSRKCINEGLN